MQRKLNEFRDKVKSKTKRSTHNKYNIGNQVYICNANSKRFSEKEVITSFTPNKNSFPISYSVRMTNGNSRIVNQA